MLNQQRKNVRQSVCLYPRKFNSALFFPPCFIVGYLKFKFEFEFEFLNPHHQKFFLCFVNFFLALFYVIKSVIDFSFFLKNITGRKQKKISIKNENQIIRFWNKTTESIFTLPYDDDDDNVNNVDSKNRIATIITTTTTTYYYYYYYYEAMKSQILLNETLIQNIRRIVVKILPSSSMNFSSFKLFFFWSLYTYMKDENIEYRIKDDRNNK